MPRLYKNYNIEVGQWWKYGETGNLYLVTAMAGNMVYIIQEGTPEDFSIGLKFFKKEFEMVEDNA